MTCYEKLSLLISVAGFGIVIWSIVILIRQTKYVAESVKTSLYNSIASQMLMMDQVFINEPELRPYFYFGKDISEDDPLYNKTVAVAEIILDFFSSVLLHQQHFITIMPHAPWEGYIIDSFANSPLLCRYLRSVKDWYTEDLVALMRKGEAKRQEANVQGNQKQENEEQ